MVRIDVPSMFASKGNIMSELPSGRINEDALKKGHEMRALIRLLKTDTPHKSGFLQLGKVPTKIELSKLDRPVTAQ